MNDKNCTICLRKFSSHDLEICINNPIFGIEIDTDINNTNNVNIESILENNIERQRINSNGNNRRKYYLFVVLIYLTIPLFY